MSSKNFMSYDDASTVLGEYADKVNELKSGLTNVDVALSVPENTGKNVLPLTLANLKARNTTGTWSGNVYTCPNVAFTVNTNDDGLVTSISTTSSGSYSDTMALEFKLPKGTYILASGFNETSGTTDTLLFKDNVVIARGNSASPGQTFTLDSESTVVWDIRVTSSDITAYPMIRPATITDSTFAPYIPSVESRIEAVESGLTNLTNVLTISQNSDISKLKDGMNAVLITTGFVIGEAPVTPVTLSNNFRGYIMRNGSNLVGMISNYDSTIIYNISSTTINAISYYKDLT